MAMFAQKTLLILSCILAASICNAQKITCLSDKYDYKHAVGKIYRYLLRADNWQYFSDNREGKEVFLSKGEFKRNSRLEIIPCLSPDRALVTSSDTVQLRKFFVPTYSQFTAFLLCRDQPTEILLSSPRIGNPDSFGALPFVPLTLSYQKFLTPGICLFFDTRTTTYAYIKGNSYFYWDYEKKDFEEVIGIAGYRNVNHPATDW